MRVCLMIEGQEDVTWSQWVALADAVEVSGLEGLFRSDHYLSVSGRRDRGSLDAWTTLAGLAEHTSRIRLGTMVSPASFRHPSVLAKSVVTVDHISNGRVELGIGAGWHDDEHVAYGFPFYDTPVRMHMLEEQIEIVRRSWGDEPFDFAGEHFSIEKLDALPKPVQSPHPNLIVGGSANQRSAALAARWADEYNTIFATAETCARRRARLEDAFEKAGRDPKGLTFSLMAGCIVGIDDAEVDRRARAVMETSGRSGDERAWLDSLRNEWIVGTVAEVIDKINTLEEAGVDRVMLQHQAHFDVEMVQLLGAEVRPAVA
jgi:F420-dependent oxidoreductase-like protein